MCSSYLLLCSKSRPKLNGLKQDWSFYYPSQSLWDRNSGSVLPGWVWLKVSYTTAIRRLELGQQWAKAPGDFWGIFLSSCSIGVSPCGLSVWATLGFEMSWQPQGRLDCLHDSWRLREYFNEQDGNWITFYNLALEVMTHHFCCVLFVTSKSETCPDLRRRELTSPVPWGAASS